MEIFWHCVVFDFLQKMGSNQILCQCCVSEMSSIPLSLKKMVAHWQTDLGSLFSSFSIGTMGGFCTWGSCLTKCPKFSPPKYPSWYCINSNVCCGSPVMMYAFPSFEKLFQYFFSLWSSWIYWCILIDCSSFEINFFIERFTLRLIKF